LARRIARRLAGQDDGWRPGSIAAVPARRAPTVSRAVGPLATHLDRPLVVVDVGCRDGEALSWTPFDPQVQLIGFEPDAAECERLQADYDGPATRTFVPIALGAATAEATLHVTRYIQSSSLYAPSAESIAAHPQLSAHEEVERRRIAITSLDGWIDLNGAAPPDFLKLDVQGAELDVLRGAEQALEHVRALQVEVEFQPLYDDQPLFADVDAHLRERGFVLWRLRGMRHLAIAGATPDGVGAGTSLPPGDAERQPSGGRLSWADAIYVRAELARPAVDTPWQAALRDACLAAALALPELTQVALSAAAASAPAHARIGIERALADVRAHGHGLPDPDGELELAGLLPIADDDPVERLTAERDWAYREQERLRGALSYRVQQRFQRRLGRARGRIARARRRARHWTEPRLGRLRQHPPTTMRVPRGQLRLRPPRDAPTISLVTPSYNQGQFIERTLTSVFDQEYPALEYVIRDGGSDDDTLAVLERYRERFDGCVSEPDGGQADAINRGFAETSGEIMGWLNSDDLLLPGALAGIARHFARHPETDVVYGHRLLIDTDDRQVGCWIMPRHQDWPLDFADLVPQETMFWRRSAWEKAGGQLDTAYRYALDWDLLLRFRDSGARIVRLPLVLGAFRTHSAQKTTNEMDVGLVEIERIRAARNGGAISHSDAWRHVRPYLRRHVVRHTVHRAAMRIPGLYAEI
jgi:FkbM family methyltransferase